MAIIIDVIGPVTSLILKKISIRQPMEGRSEGAGGGEVANKLFFSEHIFLH